MIAIPKITKEQRLRDRIVRLKEKNKLKREPKLSELKKIVQRKFNAWIRRRDEEELCISCNGVCGTWDCGHLWAQGSSGILRYNEDNCHKQGRGCNSFKHGNLLEYEINLVKKIGQKRVDYLRDNRRKTKKYTREELNELLEKYTL